MVSNIWTGNKVRLRAIVPGDWEKFHNNDYDTEGARLADMTHFPRSAEGTRLHTEGRAAEGPNGDRYTCAIETLNGELIGSIGVHTTDSRNGTFKYGIGIFRDHWRKGYASEAVKLMLGYYFDELRYQKYVPMCMLLMRGPLLCMSGWGSNWRAGCEIWCTLTASIMMSWYTDF